MLHPLKLFGMALTLGVGLSVLSCTNEKYADLVPQSGTDTSNAPVTYARVATIMTNKCLDCHSASAAPVAGGGHIYETYDQVRGSANSMRDRINRNEGDALLMPKGGPKLSAQEIRTIENWITQGRPR